MGQIKNIKLHIVTDIKHTPSTTTTTKNKMADEAAQMELKKKRTFRKFMFRGVDLDQLLDLSAENLMELVHARARRRFTRGLKLKPLGLMKKLRKAKKEAPPMVFVCVCLCVCVCK